MCTQILERVRKPLEKALSDARLTVDNIYAVEVVGLGSRVPAITNILKEFFGKEPRRSLHPNDTVSKGCALECAILSPTFKVRAFQVQDICPVTIALTWKGIAQDSHFGNADNQHTRIIFPKGNRLPSMKTLAFDMSSTFTAEFQYVNADEVHEPSKYSTYTIGPFQSTKGECATIKVEACLNRHGIVSLQNAQLIDEEEEFDDFCLKETTKKKKKWTFQEEALKKAKEYSIPISELVYGAMLEADVQKSAEKEFEMAFQDRVFEETEQKFQAVFVYVINMKVKVFEKLYNFFTRPERETFLAQLQETEDWLCGGDGEDETMDMYSAKLEELKKQGDRFERRYMEHSKRETACDQLTTAINWYKQTAKSGDPKYENVPLSEKQKVLNMCSRVENWLTEKEQLQDLLPKHVDPVLLSSDIRNQFEALDGVCRPILSTPSSPAPALESEQQSSQGGENATSLNPDAKNSGGLDSSSAPSSTM